MKSYKHWGIFSKIMSLSLLTWAILALAATFALVPYIRGLIMDEKKDMVRFLVEEASTILATYQKQAEAGILTPEDAKKRAAADIRQLRYDGKEYFFISDLNNRLIAHPLRPENEGKDMSSFKDADGMLMYQEFTKAALGDKGGGFVSYRQIKPKESKPLPKLSYTKLFKPWGWVVATGIYIDGVDEDMRHVQFGIWAGLLVILGLSVLVAGLVSRSITRPVKEVVETIKDIAQGEGDLTKRLPISGNNEIGELSEWFNTFVDKLHGIISQVSGSALQLSSSANELQSTSKEMSQSVAHLSSQSTSLATAGEEMSATSSDIAGNCHHAATNAGGASDKAAEGAGVVNQSIGIMQAIAERVKSAADTVETLGNRSDQIGTIVGTIEDIADQTNLLALNAAIEAARAGEQGRGFAVVADEVRALAERTTRATKEIGEMIKAIQKETREAVHTMEQSVAQVEQGSTHASASGKSLQEILAIINDVTEQISQIATAAEEQTATTREISHNVLSLNELAHQNNAAIQETAETADNVSRQAEELQRLVNQFKL
ncbi:methyl-accepting chemotaxis protein [Geobacter sp. FeAm09]|uniref:methyl-accepting chemotaxis protein n=1 Tax=Geobacter sp. FeAm09 TaxID=2597769 RepID=UPI0011F06CBE|nr:methyl-accepting chemotaxis protein [Geobacter sp. FeAm09]QEM68981.1 methyl-accepting chemotaxis protein [Geobacter sp. FeAm09]